MSNKTFLVSSFKVDTEESEIFWEGRRLATYGHLLCLGDEDRFIVYFIDRKKRIPLPVYIPEYNLGAIFIDVDQMDAYLSLSRIDEPIYIYMNEKYPEQNAITVNEPIREAIC